MIESYVYVPVPASRVQDVLRLVVDDSGPAAVASNRPAGDDAGTTRGWTHAQIVQLKRELKNATVVWLLESCASRPQRWVSIKEVIDGTGRGRNFVRADLAGFTKMIKREFGTDGKWPFQTDFQTADGSSTGGAGAAYRMSFDVAEWWKSG